MTNKEKTSTFGRPPQVYANKLKRFLKYKRYDKDVCLLLGVIAKTSIQKHTSLNDEILTAIAILEIGEYPCEWLLVNARITLGYGK